MSTKRIVAILLIGTMLASTAAVTAPKKAYALFGVGDVVIDPTNLIQNTISATTAAKNLLNPIFYGLAQAAIQSMVNSTVNWINSGFQGSPAYATDLQGTLQDAADQAANQFVQQFQNNLHISSPFRDFVGQSVLNKYYLSTGSDGFFLQNPYTLNHVARNDRAFLNGDFSQGGFSAWLSSNLNCSNNPLCALNAAETQLANKVAGVQGQLHEELGWGNGFLSWRKCDVQGGTQVVDNTQQSSLPVVTQDASGRYVPTGQTAAGPTTVTSLTAKQTCLSSHIETPGSVIANQINHSLGLGADSLVNAKEFDEIVNALLAQLMKNVLGSTGLSGLSQGSTASGGRPYFGQSVTNTTSSGVAVASTFLQIVNGELSQLQTYQADWQKISDAANAAKTKLQAQTSCDFTSTITTQINPVITQAATAIGKATTISSNLNTLQTQVTQAAASSDTAQQNSVFQTANTSLTCVMGGGTLGSDNLTCTPATSPNAGLTVTDFTNAQAQIDTTNSSSLLSQMSVLANQTCTH